VILVQMVSDEFRSLRRGTALQLAAQ